MSTFVFLSFCSYVPFDDPLNPNAMVSRRKILSRSRDDLNIDEPRIVEDQEDVWYQKEKLYKVRTHFDYSDVEFLSLLSIKSHLVV